jgi:tRNA (adenine37-N6)-methyltransferase
MTESLQIIGHLRSPFREKFLVPRQPGLIADLRSELHVASAFAREEFWRGLEGFSHLWLLWRFHLDARRGGAQRPTVRPPRLGGEERVGVFASRSGFRPNSLGLSVVALRGRRRDGDTLVLELGGADLVDGTPIVDVKPYLPWADALPEARGGFAPAAPEAALEVSFAEPARRALAARAESQPELEGLLRDLLALDPHPAWDRPFSSPQTQTRDESGTSRAYGARLFDFDLRWIRRDHCVEVLDLVPLTEDKR